MRHKLDAEHRFQAIDVQLVWPYGGQNVIAHSRVIRHAPRVSSRTSVVGMKVASSGTIRRFFRVSEQPAASCRSSSDWLSNQMVLSENGQFTLNMQACFYGHDWSSSLPHLIIFEISLNYIRLSASNSPPTTQQLPVYIVTICYWCFQQP
jgi:hypothetical protein